MNFKTLQIDDLLQSDRESIDSAWNQLEQTIDQMEKNLNHWKELQIDLNSIEQDLELIICENSLKSNHFSINEIQIRLEDISNHCQSLSLSNPQTHVFLEKINQINQRINNHDANIANGFHQSQVG